VCARTRGHGIEDQGGGEDWTEALRRTNDADPRRRRRPLPMDGRPILASRRLLFAEPFLSSAEKRWRVRVRGQ
jgi:hypothetical protein